jgi:hypothetical protein
MWNSSNFTLLFASCLKFGTKKFAAARANHGWFNGFSINIGK